MGLLRPTATQSTGRPTLGLFKRSATPPAAPPSAAAPAPAKPAAPTASPEAGRDGGRTAPEPLTLLLPAMAALGAIASIAAVAYTAEDRTSERPKVKRRTDAILRDLEISAAGVAELLRRIKRNGRLFGLEGPAGGAAMKFGLTGRRAEAGLENLYHQIANDLATMLVLATQNAFECISAVEDGEIEAPEAVYQGFAEAQEHLNGLIAQRASARAVVDKGIEIAQVLTTLVRQLKQHRVG